MSDYKENTVGWQLNRLKEPLRSRALEEGKDVIMKPNWSMKTAIGEICLVHMQPPFWEGAYYFFECNGSDTTSEWVAEFQEGYNMARECAPDSAPNDSLWERCEALGPMVDHDGMTILSKQQDGCWTIKDVGSDTSTVMVDKIMGVILSRWPNDPTLGPKMVDRFEAIAKKLASSPPQAEKPEIAGKINNETIEGRHDREIKELQYRLEMVLRMVGNVSEKYEARIGQLERLIESKK